MTQLPQIDRIIISSLQRRNQGQCVKQARWIVDGNEIQQQIPYSGSSPKILWTLSIL